MAPDACTCDPRHLEAGGYDPGCPRHDQGDPPKVYLEPRDWWVGYYRGGEHHYVCLLPCVVVRWRRRRPDARTSLPSTIARLLSLADEWESTAERCEKRDRYACTTCVGRRIAAGQLRSRLEGVEVAT